MLGTILNFSHKLLFGVMLIGVFLLPAKYAWIHAITYPLVYWHWTKNDGNCILTQLEQKYKNQHAEHTKPITTGTRSGFDDFPFMRHTFAEFGIQLSNREIKLYILPWLAGTCIISSVRWVLFIRRK
jgi:hypothetical protein